MKMILMSDKQHAALMAAIKADGSLEGEILAHSTSVNHVLSWRAQLAMMVLRGTADVPDARKPELPIRKFEFIRYGYDSKARRKNVLYTIKDENKGVIYYGVTRCDLRHDKFDKSEGVRIAKERAQHAQKIGHNVVTRYRFCNSERGPHHTAPMYGVARADGIKDLLEWFDGIG